MWLVRSTAELKLFGIECFVEKSVLFSDWQLIRGKINVPPPVCLIVSVRNCGTYFHLTFDSYTRSHNFSERDSKLITCSSPFFTTEDLCHQCDIYYYYFVRRAINIGATNWWITGHANMLWKSSCPVLFDPLLHELFRWNSLLSLDNAMQKRVNIYEKYTRVYGTCTINDTIYVDDVATYHALDYWTEKSVQR